jgi:predicted MFS family arabinose efflux permease
MIICDTGRALCLASIALAILIGHLTLLQIYIAVLLEGTFAVFFDLAMASCLPQIVSKKQLPAVVAQQQFSDGLSDFLGSPLGGILYGLRNIFPFLTDAVSYLVSVFSLFFVKTPFQDERKSKALKLLWKEVGEGLRWLWSQPPVRAFALLTAGINVIFPTRTLLVILIAQGQHLSTSLIGFIIGLGTCGFLLGSLLSPLIQQRLKLTWLVRGSFWLFVLFWPIFAFNPNAAVLCAVLIALSLVRPVYGTAQVSYRLAIIPDALQGRVNSVFRLATQGARPLGLALIGFLIQTSGIVPTVLVFWGLLIVLAVGATFMKFYS